MGIHDEKKTINKVPSWFLCLYKRRKISFDEKGPDGAGRWACNEKQR